MLKISVHSYQNGSVKSIYFHLVVHPWCGGSMNSQSSTVVFCIDYYCIDVVLLLLILKMCKLTKLGSENYQTKLAKKAKAKLKL